MKTKDSNATVPESGSAPPDKCPQCGDPTIQPRDHAAYCENCGWPDENRPVDPEAVIDNITQEVLEVVSPEGHEPEDWEQVREAVLKGIKPLLPTTEVTDRLRGGSVVHVEVRFSVNGKTTTHEMNGPVEMIAQSPTTIGGLFRRLVAPPQAPYKETSEL